MIPLEGNWTRGFAFDLHTTESHYLGINPAGIDVFENKYTEMGNFVRNFKYKNEKKALHGIIRLLRTINWQTKFDFIIPIPPTDHTRAFQPVTEIAIALGAYLKTFVLKDVLAKVPGGEQLKAIREPDERLRTLRETMRIRPEPRLIGKSVLLVDDLYRSGATLSIATDLLMKVAKVEVVCVLTMTKTRRHQ